MYSRTELIGYVKSQPKAKEMANGALKCEFYLSTFNHRHEKEETHIIQAWNQKAEVLSNLLKKGMKLFVHGSNKKEEWETDDGQAGNRTVVVLEDFRFLDKVGEDVE